MTELVRIPLQSGEYIIAEVDKLDIPGGDVVVLAAPKPGKAIAEVRNNLEASLRSIGPAVTELVDALKGSGPDSISVEFGVKVGGETGVILAKGTAEVNFKVAMEWKRSSGGATGGEVTGGP
jgi:Trypsin-co-occurring domain 1